METFILTEACVTANGLFAQALLTTHSKIHLLARVPLEQVAEDLHCTIIYSDKPVANIEIPTFNKDGRYHAMATEVVHWPGHDNDGYLVVKLQSEDLNTIHAKFRDAGIVPNFADYNPHISLVHPVADIEQYKEWMEHFNQSLADEPLVLELYYGGISLAD